MSEFEIQQTINDFHLAANTRNWDRLTLTFVPDGIWEMKISGRRFEGRAAIKAALVDFTAPMEYVIGLHSPGLISVKGDTATASTSLRETGKFAGRDEAKEAFGIYYDTLVRTKDGWKFARRAFDIGWMHNVPVLPAKR